MPLRTKTSLVINEFLRLSVVGGLGLVSVVAPNSLSALEIPLENLSKRLDRTVDARKIAYYLKRTQLVDITENDDGTYDVVLTDKAKRRAQKVEFDTMQIPSQSKWDGRWRLVLFDIPEEHKSSRQFLVEKLKKLNFYMLQRSLWVYPYPCLEQVEILKHVMPEIAPHLVLLETDTIDAHNHLAKHFIKILPL